MNSSTQHYDFVAPFVPSADVLDGLLQTAELDNDLIVNIQVWDAARPGYTVQLLWDDELVGETHAIEPTEKPPGDVLALLLAPEHLKTEGVHYLAYRATNPFSQLSKDSPGVTILIDRTAPGGALLAPVYFPYFTPDETVIGMIPGYVGMAIGDVIQTFCNDLEGPSITVLPEHLTTTPVTLQFDRPFLQSLNSEEVIIGYQVTDRAGNISIMSQLVNLTLQV
jgi:hypothetical protein